ncbi:MAG TPA: HlyD family efflux transporter periplasmic adaptor subunit [Kiritimatiellia bacterium]|nr:HlyD family efflux transporter periplasmic adaptor subunit [Kiritimatiellia bacterium]
MQTPVHRKHRSSVVLAALIGTLLIACGLLLLRIELTIRATGHVYARDEVRLFAPQDATLLRQAVELGTLVRAGDIVLELEDRELDLRAIQLERERAVTESALAAQRINRREWEVRPAALDLLTAGDRQKRLARIAEIQAQIEKNYNEGHARQIISELELRRQEIDRLRSEMDVMDAALLRDWNQAGLPALHGERIDLEIRRLESTLALIQRELEWVRARREALVIRAPLDGQVVARPVRHPGMAIARGAELIKIAPTGSPIHIKAYIPERNVDLVAAGTPVLMESHVFDSMLEGRVRGAVHRVAPDSEYAADAAPGTARYEIDIAVLDTPHPLVLGSLLDVRLQLGRRSLGEVFLRSARHLRDRETRGNLKKAG